MGTWLDAVCIRLLETTRTSLCIHARVCVIAVALYGLCLSNNIHVCFCAAVDPVHLRRPLWRPCFQLEHRYEWQHRHRLLFAAVYGHAQRACSRIHASRCVAGVFVFCLCMCVHIHKGMCTKLYVCMFTRDLLCCAVLIYCMYWAMLLLACSSLLFGLLAEHADRLLLSRAHDVSVEGCC